MSGVLRQLPGGGALLPAASALSGGPAATVLEEREFERTTERPPLARPGAELVCKHVSILYNRPVFFTLTPVCPAGKSTSSVRERLLWQVWGLPWSPTAPSPIGRALLRSMSSRGSRVFFFHLNFLNNTGGSTVGAEAATLCCSFDCTERGLEPREAFPSMPDDRFGPERSHFYVLGFFFLTFF